MVESQERAGQRAGRGTQGLDPFEPRQPPELERAGKTRAREHLDALDENRRAQRHYHGVQAGLPEKHGERSGERGCERAGGGGLE